MKDKVIREGYSWQDRYTREHTVCPSCNHYTLLYDKDSHIWYCNDCGGEFSCKIDKDKKVTFTPLKEQIHRSEKLETTLEDRAKYHSKRQKGLSPFCSLGEGMDEDLDLNAEIRRKFKVNKINTLTEAIERGIKVYNVEADGLPEVGRQVIAFVDSHEEYQIITRQDKDSINKKNWGNKDLHISSDGEYYAGKNDWIYAVDYTDYIYVDDLNLIPQRHHDKVEREKGEGAVKRKEITDKLISIYGEELGNKLADNCIHSSKDGRRVKLLGYDEYLINIAGYSSALKSLYDSLSNDFGPDIAKEVILKCPSVTTQKYHSTYRIPLKNNRDIPWSYYLTFGYSSEVVNGMLVLRQLHSRASYGDLESRLKRDGIIDANSYKSLNSYEVNESLDLNEKKKKKPYDSINKNAGNVEHNIAMFNKASNPIGTPCNNPVSGPMGGDAMGESMQSNQKILYVIKDRYGNILSRPNEDDGELWDRVRSMEDRSRRGLCVVVCPSNMSTKEMREGVSTLPEKDKLISALKTFDSNGKISERGSWKVANGGYDLAFEVYYKGQPVAQGMTDGELKTDFDTSEFGFTKKELRLAILSVYNDMKESIEPMSQKEYEDELKKMSTENYRGFDILHSTWHIKRNGVQEDVWDSYCFIYQGKFFPEEVYEGLDSIEKTRERIDLIIKDNPRLFGELEYDRDTADKFGDNFDVASPQEVADNFGRAVKDGDKTYSPKVLDDDFDMFMRGI